MPLSPFISGGSSAGSPFNFGALRPEGDSFDLSALVPGAYGLVMLNDSTLVVYSQPTDTLVELSMVNGNPATLQLTGNTLPLAPITSTIGQLSYDPVNSRIYFSTLFLARLRYVDLVGETLLGASVNPAEAVIAGTWSTCVTQDGENIYLSSFASTSRVHHYTFGVPGDITTLVLQGTNNYRLGNQLGSILISDDSKRLIMTTLVAPNNFGYADFRSPNLLILGTAQAPNPANQSNSYSYYPFEGNLNFSTRSRDGEYLFLNGNPGILTRFDMV